MKFSEQLWQESLPVYQAIVEHSFNQELMRGILDAQKFSYYIEQDELYLREYAKSLAIISARVHESRHAEFFMNLSNKILRAEKECVHQFFQSQDEYSPLGKQSTACLAYTGYLIQTATLEPIEVAIAASIPCPWVYWELGKYMTQFSAVANPYQKWIDFYSSQEFGMGVKESLSVLDEFAANASESLKQKMSQAFYKACVLEWLFWDEAYQLQGMNDFLTT